jgi:hypothetical protein
LAATLRQATSMRSPRNRCHTDRRSAPYAPEIDGNVYLNGATGLSIGDRARMTVEGSDE